MRSCVFPMPQDLLESSRTRAKRFSQIFCVQNDLNHSMLSTASHGGMVQTRRKPFGVNAKRSITFLSEMYGLMTWGRAVLGLGQQLTACVALGKIEEKSNCSHFAKISNIQSIFGI